MRRYLLHQTYLTSVTEQFNVVVGSQAVGNVQTRPCEET